MRVTMTPLLLALVIGPCMSCGSKPMVADPFTPSRVTHGVGVRQTGDLAGYHRFTIDDVRLLTAEDVAMDPAAKQQVSDQLRRELVVRLADGYEVVESPGAGVLRLSVVVRGVGPGPAFGLADATMQAIVTDSVTGKLLLAIRDRRSQRGQVERSLFSNWENARKIVQSWADAVDVEVEQAGL